jgi:hypothetical protein
VLLAAHVPAMAGMIMCTPETPVPLAGVGLGAFVVLGAGYRALRNRIDR